MLLRRSPRLAAKAVKEVKEVKPVKANPPSMQISELPVAINPGCMLSNMSVDGCCYQQDMRPKVKSHIKRMRDPIENLPIVVGDSEYVDGKGDTTRRKVCYSRYCPTCQEYWHQRINVRGVRRV